MKWEDRIRETLEKRTIKPSSASWDVLADKLDAAEKNKSKALYWWMGLAASVVAILFTITVFFNSSTTELQQPGVVDTQEQVEDHIVPLDKSPQQEQLVETNQDEKPVETLEKKAPNKELIQKQENLKTAVNETLIVAENDKNKSPKLLEIGSQKETLEDQKVSEIVAQINDLKGNGHTVTDADIDALLLKAQKEINYQSIMNETTLTVDANALLQDVETDLQESFRNKIFEALKNSYETVKTAVAERNN